MIAFLAGLLALGSCTRASDDGPETRTAAEWTVDPEPLVTIGELNGDPAYIFARIAAVRLLADGRIVVADGSSGTIRLYGSDGVFERQMGGSGGGPGEFRYLSAIRIAPPDTIIAYDSETFRLTKFLTTGQLVSTLRFQASDGNPELYLGSYSDGSSSHALAWIKQVPRDPSVVTPDVMQLGRFGADGDLTSLLGTAFGMRRLNSPLPFSAHFLALMLGDTVFHTDGLNGFVEAIGPTGERVRTFHVPIEEWGIEEARRRLAAELDAAGLRRLRELEGTPGLDSIPTLAALLSDDEGHLWVKRYDPATDSHWVWRRSGGEWLVLKSDGTVIARVSMPASVRLVEISGGRVAGIALDDFGVERVQVFALRGGTGKDGVGMR